MSVLVFQMFKFRIKKKTTIQTILINQITQNPPVLKEFEKNYYILFDILLKFNNIYKFSLLNLIMSKFFVNDSDDEESRP